MGEKSKNILKDLYNFRVLSVPQIKKLHFRKIETCYMHLYRLKKKGLVESKPIVLSKNGKKITSYYHLTYKGLTELIEDGFLEKRIKVNDLLPRSGDVISTLDTNELHVQLNDVGFEFIESRIWKPQQGMNYNTHVRGGLVTRDNKQYAVYILAGNAHEGTIKKIKREIGKESQTGYFMIFFKGPKSFKIFREKLTDNELSKIEYCLMPYNFIALRIPFFSEKASFVNLLTRFGRIKGNEDYSSNTSFADYILQTDKGAEYYVLNFLLLDFASLHRVKNYPQNQYENDGRKIAIFCWAELTHLVEEIADLEFIKVIEIKQEDFTNHDHYAEVLRRQSELDFRISRE